MEKSYKKILVTGGAGFIGSYIVDELINFGYEVVILDNLAKLTHDGKAPEWLNKKANFIFGDVRKKEDWQEAFQEKEIDAVIHLAAYMDNHLDFSNYIKTNVESLGLMFEVIEEMKLPIKKIIIASSQSVYGEGKYKCVIHGEIFPQTRREEQLAEHKWEHFCPKCKNTLLPLPELEDDLLIPLTPYGISKLTSEVLLLNLGRRYNIPTTALRFSIVLGPRQSFRHFYSGALRSFAVNALNNEPIEMNEDGKQLRDFVDVRDVAKSSLAVLNDFRADYQNFNVGCGVPTTVIDLAAIVTNKMGIEFRPLINKRFRVGDSRHQIMCVDKLKQLSWVPRYNLNQTVGDYIEWVKKYGNFNKNLQDVYKKMRKEGVLKDC